MRTRLSGWQVKTEREQDTMKYVEVKFKTPAHVGSDAITYKLDFPAEVEGINVKSIKVKSEENIAFTAAIMEQDGVDVIYQSLEEVKYHYDNVDILYLPAIKAFFVHLHNRGSLTTKFDIEIKGIEVR